MPKLQYQVQFYQTFKRVIKLHYNCFVAVFKFSAQTIFVQQLIFSWFLFFIDTPGTSWPHFLRWFTFSHSTEDMKTYLHTSQRSVYSVQTVNLIGSNILYFLSVVELNIKQSQYVFVKWNQQESFSTLFYTLQILTKLLKKRKLFNFYPLYKFYND